VSDTTCHVLLSTCGNADDAEKLAATLVDEGLAACVNIVPGLRSIYHWQGKVQNDAEVLLIIKTGKELEPLMTRLSALHPYELPEIIAVPITDGSQDYLKWLAHPDQQ